MVGIEISILVKPHKRQEFLRGVESLADRKRWTEGCVSVEVFEEYGEPNHFLWLERWPDEGYVQRRMESDGFHALLGAIKILGTMKKMVVVRVNSQDDRGDKVH